MTKGYAMPDFLLPKPGTDMTKWAVVACDQFTSEPSYWDKLTEEIGGAPSTLKLMLPEAYLASENAGERSHAASATMKEYLKNGIFDEYRGYVLVERSLAGGGVRKGVLLLLDLECYDWTPGAQTLIRASEKTVPERIPPRAAIRREAALELPHILVLVDDEKNAMIRAAEAAPKRELYSFNLNAGGGSIKGSLITAAEPLEAAIDSLKRDDGRGGELLFVMGDGNHSLAAAKALWEEIKPTLTAEERETHPARFALAEVVNLRDEALLFEPIHRLVKKGGRELPSMFRNYCSRNGIGTSPMPSADSVRFVSECGEECITPLTDRLITSVIQEFLDSMPELPIDYIHGEDEVIRLGMRPGACGIVLPAIDKAAVFGAVMTDGLLPRKCFSMGEARDKRYYCECRKITL